MQPDHRRLKATSQAMIVDQARRAGAARAISGVFVVLTAVAAATLIYLAVPLVLALVMLTSTLAYIGVFWLSKNPERASTAGSAIVAILLSVNVVMSAIINKQFDDV